MKQCCVGCHNQKNTNLHSSRVHACSSMLATPMFSKVLFFWFLKDELLVFSLMKFLVFEFLKDEFLKYER